jgi:hypothetical protein
MTSWSVVQSRIFPMPTLFWPLISYLIGDIKSQKSKAQISLQEVHYLGCILTPGTQRLSAERIQAICSLRVPLTKNQLHPFLGMAGFCRIWIPNFGVIAKPLYEATKGPDNAFKLDWGNKPSYKTLKKCPHWGPSFRDSHFNKTLCSVCVRKKTESPWES